MKEVCVNKCQFNKRQCWFFGSSFKFYLPISFRLPVCECPSEVELLVIGVHSQGVFFCSTLQVATILVAMAPKILKLATWFGE